MKTLFAVATLLNIQMRHNSYICVTPAGLEITLCPTSQSLKIAIVIALTHGQFDEECAFAVIPAGTRSSIYTEIEREILKQEVAEDSMLHDSELFSGDTPRIAVDLILAQLRECAVNHAKPLVFRMHLFRVAVCVLASLQAVEKWTTESRISAAAQQTKGVQGAN